MRLEPSVERRKLATLVFCDICGSTGLAERLEPEVLRGLLRRWYRDMREAVEEEGGRVEKFAGDAVMAVFGVPRAHDDDALRALRAAVAMLDRQSALSAQLSSQLGESFAVRIGVNSGEVIATNDDDSLVTGDPVNVAARLEQAAQPGEVLVGPLTVRLAGTSIETAAVGPLTLLGKASPVEAHRLVRVVPAHEASTGSRTEDFINRDEQLARLEDLVVNAVGAKATRVAVVTGPPGIGKSRIAEELLARVADKAAGLHIRCEPGEGSAALAGLARALLAAKADGNSTDEATRRAAQLAVGDPAPPVEARWAVLELLRELALREPRVVVLDDLQRAGMQLVELVDTAAAALAMPIVLVCLIRDDEPAARPASAAVAIDLGPLDDDDASRLLTALLQGVEVGAASRNHVQAAAGGNPLFAEELAAMLVDSAERAEGLGDVADVVALPPTLGALFGARLDRLDESDRLVIEAASVEGEVFSPATVEALAGEGAADRLDALIADGLLHPDNDGGPGADRLRFRHVLLREAAYGAMSKSRRADLHERAAQLVVPMLYQPGTERAARHLELAVTYRRELGLDAEGSAELAARAADAYATVGRHALAAADISRAVDCLTRAVDLYSEHDVRRLGVALALGDALGDSGEAARADSVLQAVEASASGTIALHARLARLEHRPYRELASRPVLEEVKAAEGVFEEGGDELGLARCASIRARVDHAHCRYAAKTIALEQLLEHAVAAGDERLQRSARVELALTIVAGPAPVDEALERLESLQAEVAGDRGAAGSCRCARGVLEAMAGRVSTGRELADEGSKILEELGLAAVHADAVVLLAQIELLDGRVDVAGTMLTNAVDRVRGQGDEQRFGILSSLAGDALFALGRADAAERHARAARAASSSDDMATRIHWRCLEARLLARNGRVDEAVGAARDALSLARTTDLLDLHGAAAMTLFELHSAARDARGARRAVEEAFDCYSMKGNRTAAARAQALLEAAEQSRSSPR